MAGLGGRYRRPHTGEEADIVRPAGETFPIGAYVQWRTPGPGRDALNAVLKGVTVLELDHLADAVVGAEELYLGPLRELGNRDGWTITTRGSTCLLRPDGSTMAAEVSREDVLLALELVIGAALEQFVDEREPPTWVIRSRQSHPRLLDALAGVELFERAADPS